MEVYAAQVDRMDQGVGRLLDTLERLGRLDNTVVVFLSDNGGCAEELDVHFVTAFVPLQASTCDGQPVVPGNVPGLVPGSEATYQSYGRAWAHLSNTPFREYKHWVHEGNSAVRRGGWKLVRKHAGGWELYAVESDRAEAHDLAAEHPDVVADLAGRYDAWAQRCGVLPRERVLDLYARRGNGLPPE